LWDEVGRKWAAYAAARAAAAAPVAGAKKAGNLAVRCMGGIIAHARSCARQVRRERGSESCGCGGDAVGWLWLGKGLAVPPFARWNCAKNGAPGELWRG